METNGAVSQASNESRLAAIRNDIDVLSRTMLAVGFGKTHGGNRDLYEVFGYLKHPKFQDYKRQYLRNEIAGAVIDLPVESTWRDGFSLKIPGDADPPIDWAALDDRLKAVRVFQRAHRLALLGRYSVILIGVAGAGDMAEPVERVALENVVYLQSYSEEDAEIDQYNADPESSRFGQPEIYQLNLPRPGMKSLSSAKRRVHHSRLIHVVANPVFNDIEGEPELQGILNRLMDLDKVVGGAAEIWWEDAAGKISFQADKDAQVSTDDIGAAEEQIRKMYDGLKRFTVSNLDAKMLSHDIASPKDHFAILISCIAAKSRIPQRILLGSERGDLASTQDQENFADSIRSLRVTWAEPVIVRHFIDRLRSWGAVPDIMYDIDWPEAQALSPVQLAEISERRAKAIKDLTDGMPGRLASDEELRGIVGLLGAHPGGEWSSDDSLPGEDDIQSEFSRE